MVYQSHLHTGLYSLIYRGRTSPRCIGLVCVRPHVEHMGLSEGALRRSACFPIVPPGDAVEMHDFSNNGVISPAAEPLITRHGRVLTLATSKRAVRCGRLVVNSVYMIYGYSVAGLDVE